MNASFPLQAAIHHPPELLMQAQGVRAVIFDVDGVLTDGGLYYGESGELFKRFHVLDGLGLKQIVQEDIVPIVITGRDSKALRTRLNALGITEARYGVEDKLAEAEALLKSLGLGWHEVAAMGDDWPDLPVLTRCALACVPPGAQAEVKAVAHHITQAAGGQGAVRECCDLLLVASGHYAKLLEEAIG